jgi:nitroreductase
MCVQVFGRCQGRRRTKRTVVHVGWPENERPFILFPIGYPAEDAAVPDLKRKPLEEVAVWDPPASGV